MPGTFAVVLPSTLPPGESSLLSSRWVIRSDSTVQQPCTAPPREGDLREAALPTAGWATQSGESLSTETLGGILYNSQSTVSLFSRRWRRRKRNASRKWSPFPYKPQSEHRLHAQLSAHSWTARLDLSGVFLPLNQPGLLQAEWLSPILYGQVPYPIIPCYLAYHCSLSHIWILSCTKQNKQTKNLAH